MPPHVSSSARENQEKEQEKEDDQNSSLKCVSCNGTLCTGEAGTCTACSEEAKENREEQLKLQIEELMAQVSFLKIPSPLDSSASASSCADVLLLPSVEGDSASNSPEPIPAHRAVLISRSPVFKAMLEKDMKENHTGTIKLADVTHDVLGAFVKFLYTGEATLDDQLAYNLLGLGEKYEVKRLKDYCEKFLLATLNDDNALASHAAAAKHNAPKLKDASLNLLSDNLDLLYKNEELYRTLAASRPILIIDIYEKYLFKKANTAEDIARLLGG